MLREYLHVTPNKCIVYSRRLENISVDYDVAVLRVIASTAYLTNCWNIVLISRYYET